MYAVLSCDLHACSDLYLFFFFNDTATTEIYTLSLHDTLPIYCCKCSIENIVGFDASKKFLSGKFFDHLPQKDGENTKGILICEKFMWTMNPPNHFCPFLCSLLHLQYRAVSCVRWLRMRFCIDQIK